MNRKDIYNELYRKIGNTSLLPLNKIPVNNGNVIYCKHEFENPSGSHYDRVYLRLYRHYELKEHRIQPGITPIIENTSGCAGAACAFLGKELGYETHIVAPGNLPQKRLQNIQLYTPHLYCTDDTEYVLGTQKLLRELLDQDHRNKPRDDPSRLFCLNHSQNWESVRAMEECGREIVDGLAAKGVGIDIFISAVGNGTSTMGIGGVLKKTWPTRIVAIDPAEAPVVHYLKGGIKDPAVEFKQHELYGIGAWGINFPFIDLDYIDDTYAVAPRDWEHALRLLIEQEGLYVGHTSAASLSAALKISQEVSHQNILIICYDSLDNY